MPERRGTLNDDTYFVNDPEDQILEEPNGGSDIIFASVSYRLRDDSHVEVLSTNDQSLTTRLNLTGNNLANVLYGNAGANLLIGGGGRDLLVGFGGDDTYYVDDDDNVIEQAGGGYDWVATHTSYTLGADAEIEVLAPTFWPGTIAMNLTGNRFNQSIYGNDGNNVINGGGGNDFLFGRGGGDTYFVDGDDQVFEEVGGGSDILFASTSYTLRADSHVEVLSTNDQGLTAAINLTGNNLANVLYGNAGANVLAGGGGADLLVGFGGDDAYFVDSDDIIIEGAGGGNDILLASSDYQLGAGVHVEVLTTNDQSLTTRINLTGNELSNNLYGNAGANLLIGGGGRDLLVGFGGDDTYFVFADDNVIEQAGGGYDWVATHTSYTLGADAEIEVLAPTFWPGTIAMNLTGNRFNQSIYGNDGNNVINGGGGNDFLFGRGGDDTYLVQGAGDRVFENVGEGTDTVIAKMSYALQAGSHVEVLKTADQKSFTFMDLTGNEFDNFIYGNGGNNILNGGGGADLMVGFGGDDLYYVDHAGDIAMDGSEGGHELLYTSVSYILPTGSRIEVLSTIDQSRTDAINITGNEFDSTIYGNAGSNVLSGGGGSDLLVGFGGADRFLFNSPVPNSYAAVQDFEVGVDRLVLAREVFQGLGSGPLTSSMPAFGTAATTAEHRIIYNPSGGFLSYDSDGTGFAAPVLFGKIVHGLGPDTLTIGSFEATGTLPANSPPTTVNDTAGILVGGVNWVKGNVLANDSDPEGHQFRVSEVNGSSSNVGTQLVGTYGTVSIGSGGAYTYTLDPNDPDTQALGGADKVADIFQYTAIDSLGARSTASLTVQIQGAVRPQPTGPEMQVNAIAEHAQLDPAAGALSNGGYVVGWLARGSNALVYSYKAQTFSATGEPLGEFAVAAGTNSYQFGPSVAALDTGGFVIGTTDGGGVRFQTYNNSAQLTGAPFVQQGTGGSTRQQPVGIEVTDTPGAGFAAAWMLQTQTQNNFGGYGNTGYQVIVQRFNDQGQPTSDAMVVADLPPPPGTATGMPLIDIVGLANGNVLVTYATSVNGANRTFGKILDPTGTDVGGQIDLGQFVTPPTDALPDGGLAVLSGTALRLYGGNGQLLSQVQAGGGDTLTVLSDGRIVLTSDDGQTITTRFLSPTGEAISGTITVPQVRAPYEQNPDLVELADGRLLYVWSTTFSVEPDPDGIRSRIFDPKLPPAGGTLDAIDDATTINLPGNVTGRSGNLVLNDYDPDGSTPLNVVAVNGSSSSIITTKYGGQFSWSFDGSYSVTVGGSDPDTMALGQGVEGVETFTYTISDGVGGTANGTLTVSVIGVNDKPTALGNAGSTAVGGAAAQGNVLNNDTDPDVGDVLAVGAVNGSAALVGQPVVGTYGTLVINADGSYAYTADPNDPDTLAIPTGEQRTDSFTYLATDGKGGTSGAALTITVVKPAPTSASAQSSSAFFESSGPPPFDDAENAYFDGSSSSGSDLYNSTDWFLL